MPHAIDEYLTSSIPASIDGLSVLRDGPQSLAGAREPEPEQEPDGDR